jgi:CheY-like chemotaxis protein
MHPTILVVDSHQLYRTTFCMLLQLCWPTARIVDAADARQALAVLPQHAWDCVILDSQLPELSGGELVRHLRARAHAYGQALAPLALMAAEPGMADAARSIGPTAILRKPIERAELHAALTPVLGALSVPQGARANLLDLGVGLPAALPARRAHLSQLQEHIHSLVEQTINRFPPPYAPAAHRPLLPSCRVGD